jgi:hypothetical protein
VVGVGRPPSHSDEKGTAVTNNYQSGVLDSHAAARLALPKTVSVALEEITTDMREGLLALAVGTGLQVMQQLMEADVAQCAARRQTQSRPEGRTSWQRGRLGDLGRAPGAGASTPDAHRRRRGRTTRALLRAV